MKLGYSDVADRAIRQDPPEELGRATVDAVAEAIDHGHPQEAKERLEYARHEWEIVHDMFTNWAWSFFTYIQKTQGEDALENAYRTILGSYYRSRYDGVMAASPEVQLQLTVEGLRGHLMGPGRKGEVQVVDEGERWSIAMEPCGSGGAAIQRLRSGKEPNPELFGFSEEAHSWTWGRENVCLYCGHCAFVNEILAIEQYGHPMRITEYSGDDDGHCTWYIYKDPAQIPARYYERVGKEPPEHAPESEDH